ncbi:MAG: hypothetical protein PHU64_07590 [Candidatus Omnitrophica bacterium]|nr:hypothetical protein [Candidatus Omnitrophota bacterium]
MKKTICIAAKLSILSVFFVSQGLFAQNPQNTQNLQQNLSYVEGTVEGVNASRGVIDVDGWTYWVNDETVYKGFDSLKDVREEETVYIKYYSTQNHKIISLISKKEVKNDSEESGE